MQTTADPGNAGMSSFGTWDDESLVRAVQLGDCEAMSEIYARYRDPIEHFVRNRGLDRDVAEDLASDVFLKILQHIAQFHGGSFRGWLFRIARNTVIDFMRATHGESSLDVCWSVPDPAISLEDDVLGRLEYEHVRQAIAALPVHQRRVLEMKLGGLSIPQICEEEGMRPGGVKSVLHRTRHELSFLRVGVVSAPHSLGG
ncbi:MAG: RNA polymerase sigma factor [Thermomicrobiales bacterium]